MSRVARAIGVAERTLRAQLAGAHPIPPNVASELLRFLDREGGFMFSEARAALVILGKVPPTRGPSAPLEPIEVKVDTVVLTVEVPVERRAEVGTFLEATFTKGRCGEAINGYRKHGSAKLPDAGFGERVPRVRAWWDSRQRGMRWLRLQLAPWSSAHCRLLRRVLRLASTRTLTGVLDRAPPVYVARFDVAVDYAVDPSRLLLQRPQARHFTRMEDARGAVTWYAGKRGEELVVRLYDYAARHGVPGPRARVEAEVTPKIQVPLHELRARVGPRDPYGRADTGVGVLQPFRNVGLSLLYAPGLEFGEIALLVRARDVGWRWAQNHLDATNPADAARLRGAIEKAARAPMLFPPSDWITRIWVYLIEHMKHRLLFRDDEDCTHWFWPPMACEDDEEPPSGAP